MRANSIGFYPWRGKPLIEFGENSKEGTFCQFLKQLREIHSSFRVVVVIWDNFAPHRSQKIRQTAEEFGIMLVYLPPYSPDLNPIEFIWKSIKRVIAKVFISDLEKMRQIIREQFYLLAQRLSFAKSWIDLCFRCMNYEIQTGSFLQGFAKHYNFGLDIGFRCLFVF